MKSSVNAKVHENYENKTVCMETQRTALQISPKSCTHPTVKHIKVRSPQSFFFQSTLPSFPMLKCELLNQRTQTKLFAQSRLNPSVSVWTPPLPCIPCSCVCGLDVNITSLTSSSWLYYNNSQCVDSLTSNSLTPSQLHQSEKGLDIRTRLMYPRGEKNLVSLSLHLEGARASGAEGLLKAGK